MSRNSLIVAAISCPARRNGELWFRYHGPERPMEYYAPSGLFGERGEPCGAPLLERNGHVLCPVCDGLPDREVIWLQEEE